MADSLEALKKHKRLNAYISTMDEKNVMDQAIESESRIKGGSSRSVLDGVTIAVKDNFNMLGERTTAASKMLHDYVSPYNSTVVQRLLDGGAIVVGKTNMDEFSMGSDSANSHFGPVVSPFSYTAGHDLSPGGSSGGSTCAVATRSCFAALGSDTGGSIRLPAAYCGVVGLKPTYGLLSRFGLIAYGSSLDCPSITARDCASVHALLSVVAGGDPNDATSITEEEVPASIRTVSDYVDEEGQVKRSLAGLRVGVPVEYFVEEMEPETLETWRNTVKMLEEAGAEVVEVSIPSTKVSLPTYYILASAEVSSNLQRYDGVRYGHNAAEITGKVKSTHNRGDKVGEEEEEGGSGSSKETVDLDDISLADLYTANRSSGFGSEVQRRIMVGTFVSSSNAFSSYVGKAQRVRRKLVNEFESVFENVDMLLTPTAPSPPPKIEDVLSNQANDPVSVYVNDVMTVSANLAGIPALSFPAGVSSAGLPIGLQLMGPRLSEASLLRCGHALHKLSGFTLPEFE